jgi:L-ascorbate metabolism protein UlaG (beta-lactamase superfamily)
MKLKWLGHACFCITANDGTKLVTDPYTPETAGFPPVKDVADVVIISSDNDSFHCRADLIPGNPQIINALELARNGGDTTAKGISIQAIEAFEAYDHKYHDPDANGMYRVTVDGVTIGHMGDLGNALTDEQIEFFKGIDVLLALTGGHPTIELDDLKVAIDGAQPRYVVPMHFQTLTYMPRNALWVESFLNYFEPGDIDFAFHYETELTPESLPDPTRVLVLDYVHER